MWHWYVCDAEKVEKNDGKWGGGRGVAILDRFSGALTWLHFHQLQNVVYHVRPAGSLKNNNGSQMRYGVSVRKGKLMACTTTGRTSKYGSNRWDVSLL